MKLQDDLLFAIDEAVAINEMGYDKYHDKVMSYIRTQISINEAYLNNDIDSDQFDQLIYEYSKSETVSIAGRKAMRMGKDFYNSIREEIIKAAKQVKGDGVSDKVGGVLRFAGIGAAGAARLAGLILAGPLDYALNGAIACVTIPLNKFDFGLTTPSYKAMTKPFIDEIRDRHSKKCEGILDTARALKERSLSQRCIPKRVGEHNRSDLMQMKGKLQQLKLKNRWKLWLKIPCLWQKVLIRQGRLSKMRLIKP